jgi:hypothetical protein
MAIQMAPKLSKLERAQSLLGVKVEKVTSAPISTGDYRQIDLASIRLDQSAQPREALNTDKTAEYAEAMKAGDKFPALVVFEGEGGVWLADGFHRHYAAQQAGIKSMSCRVLPGGLRDAILYSVGANATHGVPRSDADKERAVLRLLNDAEWAGWTDREIAIRCRVSHTYVANVRKKHAAVTGNVASERTYRTKHGTVATMKTAGINTGRRGGDETKEITPETIAPQGVEGGDEPEKADMEITISEPVDTRTDVEREADAMVLAWDKASPTAREKFIEYLRFVGFTITESNPATGTGGGDVDSSAERASSAVEVGAPVSPDGAAVSASSGRPEGGKRLQVTRGPNYAAEPDGCDPETIADDGRNVEASGGAASVITNSPSDGDAFAAVKGKARLANANSVEPPPSVAFTNPRCQQPDTCHFIHTRDECFDCSLAWSKRPKDEQIRLWSEANRAAEESEAA